MKTVFYRSVLLTLLYHNFFDYPMSLTEVEKWLYRYVLKKQAKNKLFLVLEKMRREKTVGFFQKKYFINGSRPFSAFWLNRKRISLAKIKIAQKYAGLIGLLPWVQMVGLTGNLSMNNAKSSDDIDLMVVAAKNRLWLSRLLVTAILKILKARPLLLPGGNQKNKICVNLWLDLTALSIIDKNLFTAHEILALKPLREKKSCYRQFLAKNQWALSYWPNHQKSLNCQFSLRQGKNIGKLVFRPCRRLFDFFDKSAYYWQSQIADKKKKNYKISRHYAYFHENDRAKEIQYYLQKKIGNVGF